MGKRKTQKPSVLRAAADMRATYRKWLMLLFGGLAICIVAIGIYYLLVVNFVVESQPGLTWILAAIAAIFLGWFGNKFSKTHRAYERYLDDHRLTNEDVKEFLRSSE